MDLAIDLLIDRPMRPPPVTDALNGWMFIVDCKSGHKVSHTVVACSLGQSSCTAEIASWYPVVLLWSLCCNAYTVLPAWCVSGIERDCRTCSCSPVYAVCSSTCRASAILEASFQANHALNRGVKKQTNAETVGHFAAMIIAYLEGGGGTPNGHGTGSCRCPGPCHWHWSCITCVGIQGIQHRSSVPVENTA